MKHNTALPTVGRLVTMLAMMLAPVMLTGCSSFDGDFKKAAAMDAAGHPLLGRWTGTWKSDANDHNGDLRAIVTQSEGDTYTARFHATWSIFSGEYSTDLTGPAKDGVIKFTGEQDLGSMFGGIFKYDGSADGQAFKSTYKSEKDHGTFQMVRPPADNSE